MRRRRRPHVLADQNAQFDPAKFDSSRARPRFEDAHFIENAIVGQFVLEAEGGDLATVDQQRRVIQGLVQVPGRAQQNGRAAVAGFLGKGVDGFFNMLLESLFQDQVFRRVS